MPVLIKICGLSTQETVKAAVDAGADLIGLVFHPKSPRYVTPQAAAALAAPVRGKAKIVALLVDPPGEKLAEISQTLAPDIFQLHGNESPVDVIRTITDTGRPVLKAFGVAEAADLAPVAAYLRNGALPLIDAKPPRDAAYPGGHGKAFDWSVLKALDPKTPFFLSGGLTPENVAEAIRTLRGFGLNLVGVDVSSGVETAPGVKDAAKIRAFVAAARAAG